MPYPRATTGTLALGNVLGGVELIVAQDNFLTPTARHADIVLPATTFWERNDVHTPWAGAGHYAIFMQKAIEPMGECRNDLDICTELARRLGIAGYNDQTEEAWLRELTRDIRATSAVDQRMPKTVGVDAASTATAVPRTRG